MKLEVLDLLKTEPIPTPNKWSIAVPEVKPRENKNGFAAQGISIPWAVPWHRPKKETNAKIM